MTIIVTDDGIMEEPESKVFVYVPKTFDAEAILGCGPKLADAANWFMDRLYLHSHFAMRENEFGFTPLKVAYLRKVIPQTFEKRLREQMLEAGVIECDGWYVEGRKSFGYRLTERFQGKHRRIPIRHPLIAENIQRLRQGDLTKLSKVHWHLYRQFERLTFNLSKLEVTDPEKSLWVNFSHMAVEQIRNREWTPVVCEYGRFHTPLTRMMSEFRSCLRLDGERVVNLDIANSQPLFLGLLFLKVLSKEQGSIHPEFVLPEEVDELAKALSQYNLNLPEDNPNLPSSCSRPPTPPYTMGELNKVEGVGEDVKQYVQLTQKGELYDFLGNKSSLTRKEFKQSLFRDVFFGQNYLKNELTVEFERLFPSVMAFIRKIKKGKYARLAWIMQKEESKLIIDGVCGRLMREHPEMPVLTIHDSIMTTARWVEIARRVIMEEFAAAGLTPTIRTEEY